MGNKINAWYVRLMSRPSLYNFHRKLYAIGLRGMGFMNSQDYYTTGEAFALQATMGFRNFKEAPIVFDIGGNKGTWSQMAREIIPKARLFAFEPVTETYKEMRDNLKFTYVNCFNLAIGERRGEVEISFGAPGKGQIMHADIKNPGRSHLKKSEKVAVETIDNFCKKNEIKKIEYLKMDIEGYEYKALLGAKRMIKEGRINFIQFEIGSDNIFNKETLYDFQKLLPDYKLYRTLPNGLMEIDLESAEAATYLMQNILAIKQ